MSTRSRSRLFPFALAVVVAGIAASPVSAVDDSRRPYDRTASEQPPAPTRAERAVKVALEAVGTPYRWGGESPATGFDCSGLVRWAYGRVGIDLPHSSYALYGEGRRVRESRMEPGDVLVFDGLGHVGLYIGNGRMVHSPETGRHVEVVRLASTNYGAARDSSEPRPPRRGTLTRHVPCCIVLWTTDRAKSRVRSSLVTLARALAKKRLDVLLVERGLAESRAQAQALVLAGLVPGHDKPGEQLAEDAELEVERPPRFVSRGGEKLQNALDAFGVDVEGATASTSAPRPVASRIVCSRQEPRESSRSTWGTDSSTRACAPIRASPCSNG